MITIVAASSIKDLNRKLQEIRQTHELRNPNFNVEVKVLKPNPNEVDFKEWEATSFTVSVDLLPKEEEELKHS
jgi:hypothetical protein